MGMYLPTCHRRRRANFTALSFEATVWFCMPHVGVCEGILGRSKEGCRCLHLVWVSLGTCMLIHMTTYVYVKEAKTEASSILAIKFVFFKLTSWNIHGILVFYYNLLSLAAQYTNVTYDSEMTVIAITAKSESWFVILVQWNSWSKWSWSARLW